MKLDKGYRCDKCGKHHYRENIASLSTNYQASGLVSYGQGNLGVRHLCSICKDEFEEYFRDFFDFFESRKGENLVMDWFKDAHTMMEGCKSLKDEIYSKIKQAQEKEKENGNMDSK